MPLSTVSGPHEIHNDPLPLLRAATLRRQAVPTTLYHFTTSDAADAILNSAALRATAFDRLVATDLYEYHYGRGLVQSFAEALRAKRGGAAGRDFGRLISKYLVYPGHPTTDFFVASFTTEGPSSALADRFAREGKTACLSFPFVEVEEAMMRTIPFASLSGFLVPVCYDAEEILDNAEHIKEAGFMEARKVPDELFRIGATLEGQAFLIAEPFLEVLAFSVKRRKYEVEHEWRMVVLKKHTCPQPPFFELGLQYKGGRSSVSLEAAVGARTPPLP